MDVLPTRLRFQALAYLGAFLAFCLELSAAKLLLPRFGGSAYVWTGSMLFFQAGLLLAYLYARWARSRPRAHAVALALPFFFLPLTLPASPPAADPFTGLMWALLLSVGTPFFILSTTIVVAQSWLMRSKAGERDDGYFLYAASNTGAACALLAYPLAIEPLMPLSAQGRLWVALYAAYAALTLSLFPREISREPAATGRAPSTRERALWLSLSAAPCAVMLAVTNLLSLNFAAVPLLWTAPLGVYLLTFVLNFRREPWYPDRLNRAMLPWAALALIPAAVVLWLGRDATAAQIAARLFDFGKFAYLLFALFALGMIFHKSLASARPSSERAMAEYYAWIAAGGLFGSALIGLAVPWLGRDVGAVALDWAGVGALAVAAVALRDWEKLRSAPRAAAGIVGLGAGSLAAYGRRGLTLDFYELDPDVVAIARSRFTYLAGSASPVRIFVGDGRLSLERVEGVSYDALVLDAFNSGAVPIHMLTKEAFEIYLRRLKPDGVILLHVSNRYLDLRPVLAAAARELGLHGASKRQEFVGRVEESRVGSVWVAISRNEAAMKRLVGKRGWYAFDGSMPRAPVWTDGHASLLAALAL